MRIDVVTIFPPMFAALTSYGIARRALEQGIWQFHAWNPRDFSDNAYRSVDDRPYGGGPGMVMQAAPLQGAIEAARSAQPAGGPLVYLSPQGTRLDQAGVARLARLPGLILLAGRYEGVDERLLQAQVDEEISVGDYVLSGGELAAMVLIDAVLRQLPGALGNAASAREDSFAAGLLDCPHYTRPDEVAGRRVPAVLLSGDHAGIRRWRLKQALGRTWQRRPDLLAMIELTVEQRQLLEEFQYEQTHSENMR